MAQLPSCVAQDCAPCVARWPPLPDLALDGRESSHFGCDTGDGTSAEGTKGRSLASRLLSKKGGKRSEKLAFGSHAQSSGRRGSSLPSFEVEEPSAGGAAYRHVHAGTLGQ